MSSTSDIQNKWQTLKTSGVDLGAPQGPQTDAGYGGCFQAYANGRIYWHPTVGVFEVQGGILTKYLAMGGTGLNPKTNNRDLGFPVSDESWLIGDSKRVSYFQWGAIYWVNAGRCISGALFDSYKQLGENNSYLGMPVSDNIKTAAWEIAYFECGCLFKPANLPVVIFSFKPPLIGNPYFAGTTPGNTLENTIQITGTVSAGTATDPLITYFKNNTTILNTLFSQKYSLKGVQAGDIIYLDITPTNCAYSSAIIQPPPIPSNPHGHPVPAQTIASVAMSASAVVPFNKQLKNRQLYNLCFTLDANDVFVVSPHCIYAKDSWDNFGATHITDSHVATRYDWVKRNLKLHPELAQAYSLFMNPNDNFRDFIKYANQLYRLGEIDVVIHTGDLVDYIFENNTVQGADLTFDLTNIPGDILTGIYDGIKDVVNFITGGSTPDNPITDLNNALQQLFDTYSPSFNGGGNFEWFINLIMGRTTYADDAGSPTEELLVPILTTLGNHDYRPLAYDPAIGVEVKLDADGHTIAGGTLYSNYQNTDWNLTRAEAIFLQTLWGVNFSIPPERALSYLIHYYNVPPYYSRRISRTGSFVKKLGSNRLVLVDTKYDAGIESLYNLILGKISPTSVPEDVQSVFQGGDTVGFDQTEIDMITNVLNDPAATGAVIVGIHAPAINPTGGEYNHYFRETEHATIDPSLMRGYIQRNVEKNINVADLNKLTGADDVKGWIVSETINFKKGSLDDNLDNGAPYGNRQEFWDACAGKNVHRTVNLVLSGHVHKHTEWRTAWIENEQSMNCYCDFYFENPSEYYSSVYPNSEKVHVYVVAGSAVNGVITTDHRESIPYPFVEIPQNQNTLNNSGNAQQWWASHSPVITQTACLGWMDYPQRQDPDVPSQNNFKPEPSFTGLRLLTIQNNVITSVKFVNHGQIQNAAKPIIPPGPRPIM